MKMVSQLTRQALSRHRLLTAAPIPHTAATPPFNPLPSQPTPVSFSPSPPVPEWISAPEAFPSAPPSYHPPRQTIYGQLMKKHDRFTERHILPS